MHIIVFEETSKAANICGVKCKLSTMGVTNGTTKNRISTPRQALVEEARWSGNGSAQRQHQGVGIRARVAVQFRPTSLED